MEDRYHELLANVASGSRGDVLRAIKQLHIEQASLRDQIKELRPHLDAVYIGAFERRMFTLMQLDDRLQRRLVPLATRASSPDPT